MKQQARKDGLLRFARNDGKTQLRDLAACFRASFAIDVAPLQSEGAGNAGRTMRPQPCVQSDKSTQA
jgi:hypothetical protein